MTIFVNSSINSALPAPIIMTIYVHACFSEYNTMCVRSVPRTSHPKRGRHICSLKRNRALYLPISALYGRGEWRCESNEKHVPLVLIARAELGVDLFLLVQAQIHARELRELRFSFLTLLFERSRLQSRNIRMIHVYAIYIYYLYAHCAHLFDGEGCVFGLQTVQHQEQI